MTTTTCHEEAVTHRTSTVEVHLSPDGVLRVERRTDLAFGVQVPIQHAGEVGTPERTWNPDDPPEGAIAGPRVLDILPASAAPGAAGVGSRVPRAAVRHGSSAWAARALQCLRARGRR